MSEQRILVYVALPDAAVLAGRLYMRVRRGRESASFEYDDAWLAHPARFALDPVYLPLGKGAFNTSDQRLFSGISDSAPDRWGRNLMARRARLQGPSRTLHESDYLLMVDDAARQGALRFKSSEDGPFLASGEPPIPPLVRLGDLLTASDRVQEGDEDVEALRLLLAPGSSLGGARPKASVLDSSGRLSIAKFPSHTDDWPVVIWEKIACSLASRAGVDVQAAALERVGDRAVLISRRFDRLGERRIAYLSAMAMVGGSDGDGAHSYLEIADAIRQHGARTESDLLELWRRMVFNVLVSNTDDHLRNHGFLRRADGWELAPAYDLNPVPVDVKPRIHALALDETSPEASLDTLLAVAAYFGLDDETASTIAGEVARATSQWRRVGRQHGLQASDLARMESAFEHDDARAARKLGA